ncbi:hypothetical protein VTJ04DRAFT_6145 [Mycothermus thermophilus]|uniref:uncharacterized protein n=1 Tax=Humicola insolens TaxID=85995 RepID=UPI0037426957
MATSGCTSPLPSPTKTTTAGPSAVPTSPVLEPGAFPQVAPGTSAENQSSDMVSLPPVGQRGGQEVDSAAAEQTIVVDIPQTASSTCQATSSGPLNTTHEAAGTAGQPTNTMDSHSGADGSTEEPISNTTIHSGAQDPNKGPAPEKSANPTDIQVQTPTDKAANHEPNSPSDDQEPTKRTKTRATGRAKTAPNRRTATKDSAAAPCNVPQPASQKRKADTADIQPTKRTRPAPAPRKTAKDRKWEGPFVWTNEKSPLGHADLRAILLHPMAWEVLSAEERQEVLAKFPAGTPILAAGTPDACPDTVALRNDDNFRHDCARYCEGIRLGQHDEEWLAQAWTAHEKHKRGHYDGYLRDRFEEDWEIPFPDPVAKKVDPAAEGSSSSVSAPAREQGPQSAAADEEESQQARRVAAVVAEDAVVSAAEQQQQHATVVAAAATEVTTTSAVQPKAAKRKRAATSEPEQQDMATAAATVEGDEQSEQVGRYRLRKRPRVARDDGVPLEVEERKPKKAKTRGRKKGDVAVEVKMCGKRKRSG